MDNSKLKRNCKKIVFRPPKIRKREDKQTAQLTRITMEEPKDSKSTGEFSKNLLLNAAASEKEASFLEATNTEKYRGSEIPITSVQVSNVYNEKAIVEEQNKIKSHNTYISGEDDGKFEIKEDESLNENTVLDLFNSIENNLRILSKALAVSQRKIPTTLEILNTDKLHKDNGFGEKKDLSAEHNIELKLQTELSTSNLKRKIFQNKNDASSILPSSINLFDKREDCATTTNFSEKHLKNTVFQNMAISEKTEEENTFKNDTKRSEISGNLKISEEVFRMKTTNDKNEGFYEDHNKYKIIDNVVKTEQVKEYKESIMENASGESEKRKEKKFTRKSALEMPENKTPFIKKFPQKSYERRTRSVIEKEDSQFIFEGSSSNETVRNNAVQKTFSNNNGNSEKRMGRRVVATEDSQFIFEGSSSDETVRSNAVQKTFSNNNGNSEEKMESRARVVTTEENNKNKSPVNPSANTSAIAVPLMGENTSPAPKPFNKRYDLANARNEKRFRFMKENNEVELNKLYNLNPAQRRLGMSAKERKRDAARQKRKNLRRVRYLHAVGTRFLKELSEDRVKEKNVIMYLTMFLQASVTPTSLLYVPHLVHAIAFCRRYRGFRRELRSIANECYLRCHAMFPIPEGSNFLTVYTSEVTKILPNSIKTSVQVQHYDGDVYDLSESSESDSGFDENSHSSE